MKWSIDKQGQLKSCENWLRGLASVCTIPFYNGEILAILEKYGHKYTTDNQQIEAVEQYWQGCAMALNNIINGQRLPKIEVRVL